MTCKTKTTPFCKKTRVQSRIQSSIPYFVSDFEPARKKKGGAGSSTVHNHYYGRSQNLRKNYGSLLPHKSSE